MRSAIVAADMDRTVIYSSSALLLADTNETLQRLLCVEILTGKPHSFVTERAAAILAELARAGVLVPTTTRTVEQYQRISLPGPTPRFALCANGGRLLRDGIEDLDFTEATARRLAETSAPVKEMLAELARHVSDGRSPLFIEKVRDVSGLFCYAVVNRKRLPEGWIENLTGFARERRWGLSVQGRKVYLVPASLTKGTAALQVVDIMGARRLLAAGDSLLDRELLQVADAAIRPSHGELHDAGWKREHVTVTKSRGVRAGEEIVEWMAQHALN